jgi:hypothetical protein
VLASPLLYSGQLSREAYEPLLAHPSGHSELRFIYLCSSLILLGPDFNISHTSPWSPIISLTPFQFCFFKNPRKYSQIRVQRQSHLTDAGGRFTNGVDYKEEKFTFGDIKTGGSHLFRDLDGSRWYQPANLQPVSMKPAKNLPQVSITPVVRCHQWVTKNIIFLCFKLKV